MPRCHHRHILLDAGSVREQGRRLRVTLEVLYFIVAISARSLSAD